MGMTTTEHNGRLGNQIIRNIAVSLIAEKHDLMVSYSSNTIIHDLGIHLYIGKKIFDNTVILNEENYFQIYNNDSLHSNLDANANYFQTKDITRFLYTYLHTEKVRNNIMEKNPFKDRYNANNDVHIHIRLGDVVGYNPGLGYYLTTLAHIPFDTLYISSDTPGHSIIHKIVEAYPKTNVLHYDEKNTIQFASTCKYNILSHGSFSAVIGYLAYFSTIYYPAYIQDKMWYGDMFSIDGWNKIDF